MTYILLVLAAFCAISFGVQWAIDQNDTPSPPAPTAEPTPPTPTCPSGYKWSKHASKCYIPPVEHPNKINAIPTKKGS